MGMYTFHAFAGAGGGILADILLGHTPVGAVEIEDYPRKVLLQRQLDGILPIFPIWDDVTTFRRDNKDTSEFIERLRSIRHNLCICGGFPCQDISSAGKGAGIKDGTRSGLWFELSRIIGDIQPARVFLENSPMLVSRGLDIVLSDLAAMGYDAQWCTVGGSCVGNISEGERFWIVANSPNSKPLARLDIQEYIVPCTKESCRRQLDGTIGACVGPDDYSRCKRDIDEVAEQMDRLKAIGNGQVPAVAALAQTILSGEI